MNIVDIRKDEKTGYVRVTDRQGYVVLSRYTFDGHAMERQTITLMPDELDGLIAALAKAKAREAA